MMARTGFRVLLGLILVAAFSGQAMAVTSQAFVTVPGGARAFAMGGAAIALTEDSNATLLNPARLVYLHGFSSGAASAKARFFRTALSPVRVAVPDYPAHRPQAAVDAVMRCIDTALQQQGERRLTLMGSSLGGYYAQYLGAHLDAVDRIAGPF